METYDLDALVPEDLEIAYRGETYVLPGDLSSEDAFRMVRYRSLLLESTEVDEQEKNIKQVMSFLLDMLKQKSPDLTACPFGVFGAMKVLSRYLEHIGLEVDGAAPDGEVDPDELPPNRAARRASSTGSPRSPKSSAGSRKRGGASPSAT